MYFFYLLYCVVINLWNWIEFLYESLQYLEDLLLFFDEIEKVLKVGIVLKGNIIIIYINYINLFSKELLVFKVNMLLRVL